MVHRRLGRPALITGVIVAALLAPIPATAGEGVIAYGRLLDGGGAVIDLINPDGSGRTELPIPGLIEDFGIPTWSPDEFRLLISNTLVLDENGECCIAFRPATVNPDGSGYNLIDPPGAPTDMYCHAWSANGQRVLCGVGGDTPGVFSFRESDGGDARRLTTNLFGGGDVAWSLSPDGSQFAFIRYRPGPMPAPRPFQAQQVGIFVAHADGSNVRQVVPYGIAMAHELASANWSPDGKHILAATKQGRLFVVRLDGTGLKQLSLDVDGGYFAYQPDWSPSGERIVFGMFVDGQPDLYVADIDGSNVTRLTDSPDFEDGPDWAARSR
jgi:Tol biopolymer transport system component